MPPPPMRPMPPFDGSHRPVMLGFGEGMGPRHMPPRGVGGRWARGGRAGGRDGAGAEMHGEGEWGGGFPGAPRLFGPGTELEVVRHVALRA